MKCRSRAAPYHSVCWNGMPRTRFDTRRYHSNRETHFDTRVDVKFWQSHWRSRGTGSWCLLKGYTKNIYCARSDTHRYHSYKEFSHLMTKPTKRPVRQAKTQISLGIHPIWSVFAKWVAKDLSSLHADSEDSDQTGRMPRLIWVFAGRRGHFVGFVMRRLKSTWIQEFDVLQQSHWSVKYRSRATGHVRAERACQEQLICKVWHSQLSQLQRNAL